jgi:choline dehydrogenase-like flavoprotein
MATMATPHHVEAVVIGAGVIGLAVARALAIKGKEVLIVERASTIGSGKGPLGPTHGDENTTPVNEKTFIHPQVQSNILIVKATLLISLSLWTSVFIDNLRKSYPSVKN